MQEVTEFKGLFKDWAIPVVVTAVSLCAMMLVKSFLLVRATRNNSPSVFRHLLASLGLPLTLTLIIVVFNIFVFTTLTRNLGTADTDLVPAATMLSRLLLIAALVIFVDRFIVGLLASYSPNSELLRNSSSVARGIVHVLVFGIGLLVLLGTLGVSITPIVASLGITSLAVALALQPTLENFFSGLQLIIDKPIRVGDFIELDSGEQGFVEKIGWRSTWIKMLPNNMVIMPNSKLSDSKLINYFYPQKELSVPVEVRVHYNADLEQVEKVTLEVAREILQTHEWRVPDYDTFVLFHTFDTSSINFTVMLRAKEYFNRFWVKSAFIKALHLRYAKEGIRIPYPIQTINLDQEQLAEEMTDSESPLAVLQMGRRASP